MSTFLTENEDEYTAADATAVPESFDRWGGTDSASAKIRGIARMALNRTAYLRKRLAKLAENNVFTAFNEFRRPLVFVPTLINEQMFGSVITADIAPNPNTNRWQLLGRFKASGGQYVLIYSGTDGDGRGSFAITYNAQWNVNTSRWTKYEAGKAATALIWRYGNLRVAGKAPDDDAAFEFWGGTYSGGGEFQCETVRTTTVIATDVTFRNAVIRTVPVPITAFVGAARLDSDGSVSTVGGDSGEHYPAWQLTVPTGCKAGTITIRHYQNQTDVGDRFELRKRSISPSSPWAITQSTVAATGAAGDHTTTLRLIANVAADGEPALDNVEYLIVWRLAASSGSANNKVQSITVARWEPGYRNS